MLKALLGCAWLASLGGRSLCEASLFDGEALVQKELRYGVAPKTKASGRIVAKRLLTGLSRHLDEYINKHEADLRKTRSMREFTEKYNTRTSNKPNIVADLDNEADAELAVMVLGFLRDPSFFNAARAGMKNVTGALKASSLRTGRRVNELIVASELTRPKDMPRVVNEFFSKEMHIAESVAHSTLDSAMRVISAAPGYEASLGKILAPLVDRMKNDTTARLNSMLHSYLDSRGSSFCKKPLFEFGERILTIEEVPKRMPMIEAFIKERTPDVAPQAKELLQMFSKTATDFAQRLRDDIRISLKKVCEILGVEVATVTPMPSKEQNATTERNAEEPLT